MTSLYTGQPGIQHWLRAKSSAARSYNGPRREDRTLYQHCGCHQCQSCCRRHGTGTDQFLDIDACACLGHGRHILLKMRSIVMDLVGLWTHKLLYQEVLGGVYDLPSLLVNLAQKIIPNATSLSTAPFPEGGEVLEERSLILGGELYEQVDMPLASSKPVSGPLPQNQGSGGSCSSQGSSDCQEQCFPASSRQHGGCKSWR
mmetsp:Transcript_53796/g.128166  ORF Transcript_53796/g.128166 Transcript_53796/m.128166 type:complete len:201 (-) Transcript_53796:59-661(-)